MPVIGAPVRPTWAGSSARSSIYKHSFLPESLARTGPEKRQPELLPAVEHFGLAEGQGSAPLSHLSAYTWDKGWQMGPSKTPGGLGVRFPLAWGPSRLSAEKSTALGRQG